MTLDEMTMVVGAEPRPSWRRDPLPQEYEGERVMRGIALGLVLSFVAWAALWLLWGYL
jgi:hypothetical protein